MPDSFSLIKELRNRLRELELAHLPPRLLPEPALPTWNTLEWGEPTTVSNGRTLTLDEARGELTNVLYDYLTSKPKHILLIAAQPGVGKSHGAIEVAQQFANEGKRIGYLMDRHKIYEDIEAFDHFRGDLWYHWLSTSADDPDNPENKMCLWHDEAEAWTSRGYKLKGLCEMLCRTNGHIDRCAYRLQSGRPERIIAGVHEHAVNGMAISNYHAVFVDELPLRAFIQKRHIPQKEIYLKSGGPVSELLRLLENLSKGRGKGALKGKPLMDIIGPLLSDVYAQVEDVEQWLPQSPLVTDASQVYDAEYWYLQDLLLLLAPEWHVWKEGWDKWLERVIVTPAGLDLILRDKPWKKLPKRLVILDATGREEIYSSLFNRPVQAWRPHVERRGKVYQIVNRYNGKTTFLDDEGLDRQGEETKQMMQNIINVYGYEKPGIITFKGAEKPFKLMFGDRTAHFYGQRGTNTLKECDSIFIAGCPSPNDYAVIQTYASLYPDAIRPFSAVTTQDGKIRPIRTELTQTYNFIREDGKSPRRRVSGFWWEPDLQAVYRLYREDELLQAIHRGRPLTNDCDVWLLTSIPVNEWLDGIYENPGDALNCPENMAWQQWVKIKPWLDGIWEAGGQITNEMLAELADVTVQWVYSQGWLETIARLQPERWQIGSLQSTGRGRRKKTLYRA